MVCSRQRHRELHAVDACDEISWDEISSHLYLLLYFSRIFLDFTFLFIFLETFTLTPLHFLNTTYTFTPLHFLNKIYTFTPLDFAQASSLLVTCRNVFILFSETFFLTKIKKITQEVEVMSLVSQPVLMKHSSI